VVEAATHISENVQALETAIRSSVEAIETKMQLAVGGTGSTLDSVALSDLQAAVEQLTLVLQNRLAVPEFAEPSVVPANPDPARRGTPPRLAGELRRLIQEIDAG
jgi:hypothetical protein